MRLVTVRYRRAFATLLVVVVFAISSCSRQQPTGDSNTSLVAAVSDLYLARFGLDYPGNQDILAACKKKHHEPCLSAFERVETAKNLIQSMPPDQALDSLLTIVDRSCDSANEHEANVICYGAVMAFYLFSSTDADAQIMAAFNSFSKPTRSKILNGNFAWFRNRPDFDRWQTLIKNADVDWDNDEAKRNTLNAFRSDVSYRPLWVTND